MTVATTQSSDWHALAAIVLPNLAAYCKKQDYDLEVWAIPPTFEFHKIRMLLNLLENGCDVLCLDLDTYITNHNVRVESFMDDDHDFYITQDINEINAGAIIAKSCPWVIDWMRIVLDSKDTFENEQNALKIGVHHQRAKILPHPSINSYPYDEYAPNWGLIPGRTPLNGIVGKPTHEQGNWQEGDFIMHLPGLTNSRRIEIFSKLK